MEATYEVFGQVVRESDNRLQGLLARAYSARSRAKCMCKPSGVDMYIANVSGKYVIKRMPNSGTEHLSTCTSYVPPAELSGLGQVLGQAIKEGTDGAAMLRLDFSLTKSGNRLAPTPSEADNPSVKSDGSKLTLRGLMHYLWDQASFTRWSPNMEGKRHWSTLRRYIMEAAQSKMAKGQELTNVLYMPEAFSVERKDEIAERRLAFLSHFASAQNTQRRLMLVMGVVKNVQEARFGYKFTLRQAADFPILMDAQMYSRIGKRFSAEFGLWDTFCRPDANRDNPETVHLFVIGTVSIDQSYVARFEEVSLMLTTENYIPFESLHELFLIRKLTQASRRFTKGLRYNLHKKEPIASAVLTDTGDTATSMYILPPDATDEYADAVDALIDGSELAAWLWTTQTEESMPELPLPHRPSYEAPTN